MEPLNEPNEDIEKLSRAIMKAIATSKDVRNIIEDLKGKNCPIDKSIMVLMLELRAIMALTEEMETFFDKKKQTRRKRVTGNIIDGRMMTKKEIEYYKYCSVNFNQDEWLKKNGIFFQEDEPDLKETGLEEEF